MAEQTFYERGDRAVVENFIVELEAERTRLESAFQAVNDTLPSMATQSYAGDGGPFQVVALGAPGTLVAVDVYAEDPTPALHKTGTMPANMTKSATGALVPAVTLNAPVAGSITVEGVANTGAVTYHVKAFTSLG